MPDKLQCYRCGGDLTKLTLPLSRRDLCPGCGVHVHVCRMCTAYDPSVPKQCREDDAEEVLDKEKVNFCDWFLPAPQAFDPARASAQKRAERDLAALFGEAGEDSEDDDDLLRNAEDLFR